MGYDITVTDPNLYGCTIHFYMSYNHSKLLSEYGFYPRDFNDKTIKEVLLALNASISKFIEKDIWPDNEIRTFSDLCKLPKITDYERQQYDRINARFYEDKPNVLVGILMDIRDTLEKKAGLNWIWESD